MPFGKVGRAPTSAPLGASGFANLVYNGGRVISNVRVVQVIYGSGTYLPQTTSTGSPSVSSFLKGISNSPYIDWLSEYNTTGVSYNGITTNQTISRGTFAGQYAITPASTNNGSQIDDSQVQAELAAQIDSGNLPAPAYDAQGNGITLYAIYFRQGQQICVGGSCSLVSGGFCAYHGTFTHNGSEIYYTVEPDLTGTRGCGASTDFGNTTSVQSHELIESITDAEVGLAGNGNGPPLAWYDNTNGEIGDICNTQQGSQWGSDGVKYVVQLGYSDSQGNCVSNGMPTQASSTSVSSSSNPGGQGQPVTLTATVAGTSSKLTATGTVTFTDGTTTLGTVPLNGGTASLTTSSLSAGAHTITGTYGGDGTFYGSSGSLSQNIGTASSTTLQSSQNPSAFGQSVALTATVSGSGGTPTGNVTFSDGTATLGTSSLSGGTATFTTSTLAVGPHTITATYAGDGTFGGSAGNLTQTVSVANSTTQLTSSANPSGVGQPVTFTATVTSSGGGGAPTGMVTFTDGATVLGTSMLTGGAATLTTASLSGGSHTITAAYSGDSNFNASSTTLTQQVRTSSTTKLSSSANPSAFGQSVTFTTAVSGSGGTPTGNVTFSDGTATLGTSSLSGGTATFTTSTLAVGPHTITATYAGDPTYDTSSATITQTTTAAGTSTKLTSSANPSVIGQTVTFTATVGAASGTGTPTGSVTFTDGSTALGTSTLKSGTATLTTASLSGGPHTIKATYSGDGNFNSSSDTLTQTVGRIPTTLVAVRARRGLLGLRATVSATLTRADDGAPIAGQTVAFGLPDGDALCSALTNGSGVATCTGSLDLLDALAAQRYTASYAGSDAYQASNASGSLD